VNEAVGAPARRRRRIGVVGTMVWDIIHGRDPRDVPVQEWGGIAYALSAFDATLSPDCELVPIVKIGSDLAPQAREWFRTLRRLAPDARPIEVPHPNNRVELRYTDDERRSEVLSGGVPPWTWQGLAPLLHNLDALYINFISGFELDLETAQLVRQHFRGPIYADLHSLLLGVDNTGLRTPQPMWNVESWCQCFDFVQVNEAEQSLMAPDGMALAATALAAGVRCLVVTLGRRGIVYFVAPGFERLSAGPHQRALITSGAIRTALIPSEFVVEGGDPTGCGDVWGAAYFARLVAGDMFEVAMRTAIHVAARNVVHRGATSLASFLRGELSAT
jgi:hypothetical protein